MHSDLGQAWSGRTGGVEHAPDGARDTGRTEGQDILESIVGYEGHVLRLLRHDHGAQDTCSVGSGGR